MLVYVFAASSVDVCPLCKKVLHTKKSLKTHIEAIHHSEFSFQVECFVHFINRKLIAFCVKRRPLQSIV